MTEPVSRLDATDALGMFVAAWSELEVALELVIAQELKLDRAKLSSLLEQKHFISRMNILKSFLQENEAKNKDKIEFIKYKHASYKKDDWIFGRAIIETDKIFFVVGFNPNENALLARSFTPVDLAYVSQSVAANAAELMIVFKVDSSLRQGYFSGLS